MLCGRSDAWTLTLSPGGATAGTCRAEFHPWGTAAPIPTRPTALPKGCPTASSPLRAHHPLLFLQENAPQSPRWRRAGAAEPLLRPRCR